MAQRKDNGSSSPEPTSSLTREVKSDLSILVRSLSERPIDLKLETFKQKILTESDVASLVAELTSLVNAAMAANNIVNYERWILLSVAKQHLEILRVAIEQQDVDKTGKLVTRKVRAFSDNEIRAFIKRFLTAHPDKVIAKFTSLEEYCRAFSQAYTAAKDDIYEQFKVANQFGAELLAHDLAEPIVPADGRSSPVDESLLFGGTADEPVTLDTRTKPKKQFKHLFGGTADEPVTLDTRTKPKKQFKHFSVFKDEKIKEIISEAAKQLSKDDLQEESQHIPLVALEVPTPEQLADAYAAEYLSSEGKYDSYQNALAYCEAFETALVKAGDDLKEKLKVAIKFKADRAAKILLDAISKKGQQTEACNGLFKDAINQDNLLIMAVILDYVSITMFIESVGANIFLGDEKILRNKPVLKLLLSKYLSKIPDKDLSVYLTATPSSKENVLTSLILTSDHESLLSLYDVLCDLGQQQVVSNYLLKRQIDKESALEVFCRNFEAFPQVLRKIDVEAIKRLKRPAAPQVDHGAPHHAAPPLIANQFPPIGDDEAGYEGAPLPNEGLSQAELLALQLVFTQQEQERLAIEASKRDEEQRRISQAVDASLRDNSEVLREPPQIDGDGFDQDELREALLLSEAATADANGKSGKKVVVAPSTTTSPAGSKTDKNPPAPPSRATSKYAVETDPSATTLQNKGEVENCSFKPVWVSVIALSGALIGLTLGLVIGGVIGTLLGAWAGPGAMFTALGGMVTGAATGAALGVMIASTLLTLVGAYTGLVVSSKMFYQKDLPPLNFCSEEKEVDDKSKAMDLIPCFG